MATLLPQRARTVANAIVAAFGPADGGGVDRDAARLVADLWRTIAPRAQSELRELLLTTERHADVDGARRAAFESGARAGLIACGDVATSLRESARASEIELSGDPPALASQLATTDSLARLVRFALGHYAD